MIPDKLTWDQLHLLMSNCQQFEGQSILEHGWSVLKHYEQLVRILERDQNPDDWKLPSWFKIYRQDLLRLCYDNTIISWYLIYHDLGKPFVITYDQENKKHFPNHSTKSCQVWKQINQDDPKNCLNNEQIEVISRLILHDMDLHLLKEKELEVWVRDKSPSVIITLLLAALSEIHSNARFSGGQEAISFKAKWKQLDRRGKSICKKLFGEKL